MREIKFRVWNDVTKSMHFPGWKELAERAKLPEMRIMEFTGLKDKNGKGIYEEDIIKDKNGIIWTVYFLMGSFSICCSSKEMSKAIKRKKDKTEEDILVEELDAWWLGSEVIGNTHEPSCDAVQEVSA